MNISLTSYSEKTGAFVTTYGITFYRHRCVLFVCNDDLIGSATVPRDGYGSGRWTSVGSGDYFFSFSKANDGFWVDSNSVYMYSN